MQAFIAQPEHDAQREELPTAQAVGIRSRQAVHRQHAVAGCTPERGQTHGIRAVTVVPGAVVTPRQKALWHNPDEEARILAGQCIPERVEMEDVAALALFLASNNARHISGREYFVDAVWYGA